MKITKFNSQNFGKKSEYHNYHQNCQGEPMLSVVARQVIAKTPRLSNGYCYQIERKGQDYRFAKDDPINFHDQLALTICDKNGNSVTEPQIIYYKRVREPDMTGFYSDFHCDEEHFGRLNREDLIGSLKRLLTEMRTELRECIKNRKKAQGIIERPTRSLHLSLRLG